MTRRQQVDPRLVRVRQPMVGKLAREVGVRPRRDCLGNVIRAAPAKERDPSDRPSRVGAKHGGSARCGLHLFREFAQRICVIEDSDPPDTVPERGHAAQSEQVCKGIVDPTLHGVKPRVKAHDRHACARQINRPFRHIVSRLQRPQRAEDHGVMRNDQVIAAVDRAPHGVPRHIQCNQNPPHLRAGIGATHQTVVVPIAGQRARDAFFQFGIQFSNRHMVSSAGCNWNLSNRFRRLAISLSS